MRSAQSLTRCLTWSDVRCSSVSSSRTVWAGIVAPSRRSLGKTRTQQHAPLARRAQGSHRAGTRRGSSQDAMQTATDLHVIRKAARLARPEGLEPSTHSLEAAWFTLVCNASWHHGLDIVRWCRTASPRYANQPTNQPASPERFRRPARRSSPLSNSAAGHLATWDRIRPRTCPRAWMAAASLCYALYS
jgi:hypothetical protein